MGKNKKLKWCSRPGCEKIVKKPGCWCNRRAICECGAETCWKCGDPYHEAKCKVSGQTGFILHNADSRVAKCPQCRSIIYKPDGCNHMACSRCRGSFCWICRKDISREHYEHFEPTNLFGCQGFMMTGQCVPLWVLMMVLQIIFSPIQVLMHCSMHFGEKIVCTWTDHWTI